MKIKRSLSFFILTTIFIMAAITSCGETSKKITGNPIGSEGGPCYGNKTCDGDLVCENDICVDSEKLSDSDKISDSDTSEESTDEAVDEVADEIGDEVIDEVSDETADEESDETDSDIDEVVEGWEQVVVAIGAMAEGVQHPDATCGLYKDHMYCWGNNEYGIFGNATTESSVTPVIAGGASEWKKIATTLGNACALDNDGKLYCWGSNYKGWLGDDSDLNKTSPILMFDKTFIDIRIRSAAVCGLTFDNEVWCRSYATNRTMVRKATGVFELYNVNCGRYEEGTSCWDTGINIEDAYIFSSYSNDVMIGTNGVIYPKSKTPIVNPLINIYPEFKQVDGQEYTNPLGQGTFCGIDNNDELYCWVNGDRTTALIGKDDETSSAEDGDMKVTYGLKIGKYSSMAVGRDHACAITTDKRLFCWGANDTGQTGIGYTSEEPVDPPVEINLF